MRDDAFEPRGRQAPRVRLSRSGQFARRLADSERLRPHNILLTARLGTPVNVGAIVEQWPRNIGRLRPC